MTKTHKASLDARARFLLARTKATTANKTKSVRLCYTPIQRPQLVV